MDTSSSKYSTVCPYLIVSSVEQQLDFLIHTFECELVEEIKNEEGFLQHAELKFGEVVIMMGRARKEWPARKSMNYVFVHSTEEVYQRAIENGATTIMEPAKRDYGLLEAGVTDVFGNQWWIGQELSE